MRYYTSNVALRWKRTTGGAPSNPKAWLTADRWRSKMKYDNLDLPELLFLEGCVDECDINGDYWVKKCIFPYGKPQWNPKLIEVVE